MNIHSKIIQCCMTISAADFVIGDVEQLSHKSRSDVVVDDIRVTKDGRPMHMHVSSAVQCRSMRIK